MSKHRDHKEMLDNISTVEPEDISSYAIFSPHNDREKSKNLDDLIGALINYCKANPEH